MRTAKRIATPKVKAAKIAKAAKVAKVAKAARVYKVYRHANCPINHRTAEAAERCRNR